MTPEIFNMTTYLKTDAHTLAVRCRKLSDLANANPDIRPDDKKLLDRAAGNAEDAAGVIQAFAVEYGIA